MTEEFVIEEGIVLRCTSRQEEVIVPDGVKGIGKGAFKGCVSIKRIILPDSVEKIAEHAFKGCRQLQHIQLSKNLQEIGEYAFHRCHQLEEIELPSTVKRLRNCVFLYCDSLRCAKMPGVTTLGKQTFLNDVNLEEIVLAREVDPDSICECFTGCNKIRTIILESDTREVFAINHVVDILSGKEVVLPIIRTIVSDIYAILEIEQGILVRYLNNVKHVELPEGITAIAKSCFYDKRGIQSIVFPKSLQTIGARAFRNCISLEKVEFLREDVEIEEAAFQNCSSLCEIRMPGNRTYQLSGLRELSGSGVSALVQQIHSQVLENFVISGTILIQYRGCESKVIVPEGVTIIGPRAFAGNEAIDRIELPDTVREIGREAFAGCVVLQSIVLSNKLEWIEEAAFLDCVKLIRIHLSDQVSVLPASCFKHCYALQEVSAQTKLQVIEELAFYGCRKLRQVEMSDNVKKIGDLAFYGCSALQDLHVLRSQTEIGRLAFAKSGVEKEWEQIPVPVKNEDIYLRNVFAQASIVQGELVIPEGTKKIDAYAFFGNEILTSVIFPDSLQEIGEFAFYGCSQLRNVQFPKEKLVLHKGCFEKCVALKTVNIILESVPQRAFAWCKNLENVQMDEVWRIEKEAFQGCVVSQVVLDNVSYIGKSAFAMCDELQTITIKQNAFLDAYSFLDCGKLEHIVFETITEDFMETNEDERFMDSAAFQGCTSLKNITYKTVTGNKTCTIEGYNSLFDSAIPLFVKRICVSAWSVFDIDAKRELIVYNGLAQKVTIPFGITSIGKEAFRDKETTKEIVIPESVKQIGARAFDKTQWLREQKEKNPLVVWKDILLDGTACKGKVSIPSYIQTISGWAFANNMELTEIQFEGMVKVEAFAFRNCIYLNKITLHDKTNYFLGSLEDSERTQPSVITQIIKECYNCFKMQEDLLIECTGNIEQLKLPKGIRRIGREVFKESNLLTCIILNGEVTEIEDSAFVQCKWLQAVKNANSLTQIGKKAFSGCIRLEEIDGLGEQVSIGEKAFEDCISLKSLSK